VVFLYFVLGFLIYLALVSLAGWVVGLFDLDGHYRHVLRTRMNSLKNQ
jgi:hypothetical protein